MTLLAESMQVKPAQIEDKTIVLLQQIQSLTSIREEMKSITVDVDPMNQLSLKLVETKIQALQEECNRTLK